MGQATFYYKNSNAPKPNKPNHIGATILINYDGKVLLESRKDSERWAFIGGGLFLNETLLECVKRETFEETGIILSDEDIEFCKLYDDPSIIIAYPDGNIIRSMMALYEVTLKKMPDLRCSEESVELRFFSKEEFCEPQVSGSSISTVGKEASFPLILKKMMFSGATKSSISVLPNLHSRSPLSKYCLMLYFSRSTLLMRRLPTVFIPPSP